MRSDTRLSREQLLDAIFQDSDSEMSKVTDSEPDFEPDLPDQAHCGRNNIGEAGNVAARNDKPEIAFLFSVSFTIICNDNFLTTP